MMSALMDAENLAMAACGIMERVHRTIAFIHLPVMNTNRRLRLCRATLASAVCVIVVLAAVAHAQSGVNYNYNYVPKQVHLVPDGDKLFASNVKFNRFDELKFNAQERVLDQQVGAAVAIVVTNRRIAAYGVMSGWRSLDRIPNEQIESITAEDYAGLIVTSLRMVNFNGQNGVFAEKKRAVAH
jgi:hypothetical protein